MTSGTGQWCFTCSCQQQIKKIQSLTEAVQLQHTLSSLEYQWKSIPHKLCSYIVILPHLPFQSHADVRGTEHYLQPFLLQVFYCHPYQCKLCLPWRRNQHIITTVRTVWKISNAFKIFVQLPWQKLLGRWKRWWCIKLDLKENVVKI